MFLREKNAKFIYFNALLISMNRIVKRCENKKCKNLFNAIFNLKGDKKGNFKAVCPWCKYKNKLNKEINEFILSNL